MTLLSTILSAFSTLRRIRLPARLMLLLVFPATAMLLPVHALAATRTVLIFGDSLSAGYGITLEQSWPALLDKRLTAQANSYRVVNASISGETTAGGRARLAAALKQFHPAVVVLALGANDGLRGLPVAQMRENLEAMLQMARQQKIRLLLIGIRLPPNYGPAYTQAFEATFSDLAATQKVSLLPFLLAPIAADPAAFQADRLHPVAAAQAKLLDHIWPALRPLLK